MEDVIELLSSGSDFQEEFLELRVVACFASSRGLRHFPFLVRELAQS